MNKIELIKKIEELGFPEQEIAISCHDYFKQNNCIGSIIPNYDMDPQVLYNMLKELCSSGVFTDVLVRVCDLDEDWPYSDSIYVLTSLNIEEIKEVFSKCPPDEIIKGWMYGKPQNISIKEDSETLYTIWWD